MRRTRQFVLPVKSWRYVGLLVVSLACLTLGLVSRDRGGRSESLAGPELKHTAPHEVDACPNLHPFNRLPPYDESARENGLTDNSLHTQTFSDGSTEETRSKQVRDSPTRGRRSISTDRRIRSADGSQSRDDRSTSAMRTSSRNLEAREKRVNVRSVVGNDADRNAPRRFTRHSEPSSERSSRSGSPDFRRSSVDDRQRRSRVDDRQIRSRVVDRQSRLSIDDRQHRSIADDRRRQETSVRRTVNTEKQRLTPQSYNERREDRIARSRSLVTDTNRRERINGLPRRSVRSANTRKIRDGQLSRFTRSRDNRLEGTENRKYEDRLETGAQEGRSTEHRDDIRGSAISRSLERSVERRNANRQERRTVESAVSARRSRSADFERANANKMAVRSEERDTRQWRSERGETSARTSERNLRRVAIGARDERRTSSRRIDDRRDGADRTRVRERPDVRRTDSRSDERRVQTDHNRRNASPERSVDRLVRRVRHESERNAEDRTTARLLAGRIEPRLSQRRQTRLVRSENPQEVNGQRSWVDSLRRDVRSIGRSRRLSERNVASRDVSRERRTSATSDRSESLRVNSSGRRGSTSASEIGERGERPRDIPAGRRDSATERSIARELRTSSNERSTARISRQTSSKVDSREQRTGRMSTTSRSETSERPHRVKRVDVSARRTDRSTEIRPDVRKLVADNEIRRRTSGTRKLERTSERHSLQRDIRSYETSRTIENREKRTRERSTERSVTRHPRGRSVEAATIPRQSRETRGQDGVDGHEGRKMVANDIRAARRLNNRQTTNNPSRTVFTDIPDFADLGEFSKSKNNDAFRQAVFLALCAIYGASLLKRKGGFYSFRDTVTPMTRFFTW